MNKRTSFILNIVTLALVAICVITLFLPFVKVKVGTLDRELWNESTYTRAVKEPNRVRFGVGFLVNTALNFGDVIKCLDIRGEDEPRPSLNETEEIREKLENNKSFANAVMGVFVIFNALGKGAGVEAWFLIFSLLLYALAGIILLVSLIKSIVLFIKQKGDVTVKHLTGKFEAAPLFCWFLAIVLFLNCFRLISPKPYDGLEASVSVWTVLCFVCAFAICSVRVAAEIISTEDSDAKSRLLNKQAFSLASSVFSTLCLIMLFPIAANLTGFLGALICLINVFVALFCSENVIARFGMFIKDKGYTERKASLAGGVLLAVITLIGCILNAFNVFSIIGLIGAIVFMILELVYHSKYGTVQTK
ncbi:MAG: hypothetical protein IJF05_03145 [Clostridia bacterium]|nr:hypothetical protein [Clostridia bacterium]